MAEVAHHTSTSATRLQQSSAFPGRFTDESGSETKNLSLTIASPLSLSVVFVTWNRDL